VCLEQHPCTFKAAEERERAREREREGGSCVLLCDALVLMLSSGVISAAGEDARAC